MLKLSESLGFFCSFNTFLFVDSVAEKVGGPYNVDNNQIVVCSSAWRIQTSNKLN